MLKRKKVDGKEVIEKKSGGFQAALKREIRNLESFELNEDSLKSAGDWPISVKFIGSLLLVSLTVFISYQFYFNNLSLKYDKAVKEEVTLKDSVLFKIQQTAGVELYKERIEEMEENFKSQLSQLPTAIEMDGVLKDITERGISNGIEFKKFQMLKEVISEFYIEHPIEIVVEGTYHSLGNFISEVANLDRIVTFHDFELKKISEEEDSLLSLTIIAKTYKYRNKEIE